MDVQVAVGDAESEVDPHAQRDQRIFAIAGWCSIFAAVGIGLSYVLPWAYRTTSSGATLQYEVLKTRWFGLLLVGSAVWLLVAGVLILIRPFRPNLIMPMIPTMATGLAVADIWTQLHPAGTTTGAGAVFCLVGIALGVIATFLMIPTEHGTSQ